MWTRSRSLLIAMISVVTIFTVAQAKEVSLKWKSIDGAQKYNLEVSKKQDFSKTVLDETVKINSYPADLKSGVYYIRVQGIDQTGRAGKWSEPFKMVVTAPITSTEEEENSKVKYVKKAPKLGTKWKSQDVVTSYKVLIEMDGKVIDERETKSSKVDFQPTEPGRYVIKVRAGFGDQYGPATVIRKFTVEKEALSAPAWETSGTRFRASEHIQLKWTSVDEADGYKVVIRKIGNTPKSQARLPASEQKVIVERNVADTEIMAGRLTPGRYAASVEAVAGPESASSNILEFDVDKSKAIQVEKAEFLARYLFEPVNYKAHVTEAGSSDVNPSNALGGAVHAEGTLWFPESRWGGKISWMWGGFTVQKTAINYNDLQFLSVYKFIRPNSPEGFDLRAMGGLRAWTMPTMIARSGSTREFEVLNPSLYGPMVGLEGNKGLTDRLALHFRSGASVPLYNSAIGAGGNAGNTTVKQDLSFRTEAGTKFAIGRSFKLLALAGYRYDKISWKPTNGNTTEDSYVTMANPTLSVGIEAHDDPTNSNSSTTADSEAPRFFSDFTITAKYGLNPTNYSASVQERPNSNGSPSQKNVYAETAGSGEIEGVGWVRNSRMGVRMYSSWSGFTFGGTTVSYPNFIGQWGYRILKGSAPYDWQVSNFVGARVGNMPTLVDTGPNVLIFNPTVISAAETVRVEKKLSPRWNSQVTFEVFSPFLLASRPTTAGQVKYSALSYRAELGLQRSFSEDLDVGFGVGYRYDQLKYDVNGYSSGTSIEMSSPVYTLSGSYAF